MFYFVRSFSVLDVVVVTYYWVSFMFGGGGHNCGKYAIFFYVSEHVDHF
jgi:hypothetical protein